MSRFSVYFISENPTITFRENVNLPPRCILNIRTGEKSSGVRHIVIERVAVVEVPAFNPQLVAKHCSPIAFNFLIRSVGKRLATIRSVVFAFRVELRDQIVVPRKRNDTIVVFAI